MLPDALPTTMADKCGDQFMPPCTQAQQMRTCCRHIGWLIKPGAIANQQLISANHQRIGRGPCHTLRLGIGQDQRGLIRGNPLSLRGFLDGGLIHAGDAYFEAKPSAFQYRAPRLGC
jgi:hypothetical protein